MEKSIFIKGLEKIGTKLTDFEEIPNVKKNLQFTILGRGNFGYAEKMKSKKNNTIYAIKKLNKENIIDKNFKRETEIMLDLNHPNIVKFYGYFEDKESITKYKEIYKEKKNIENEKEDKVIYCLVLEFLPKGSLNDYLKRLNDYNKSQNKPYYIQQDFIIKILKQLLCALIYLSEKSIIHRDVKPDNILIDEYHNIKLTDFGISALYKDDNPINKNKPLYLFGGASTVGRKDFLCPEMLKHESYDFESDIFTLGLTILCLISTKNPIERPHDDEPRKVYTHFINQSYNKYLTNLVLLMIKEDPKMRPTAKQAYDNLIQIENFIKKNEGQNKSKIQKSPIQLKSEILNINTTNSNNLINKDALTKLSTQNEKLNLTKQNISIPSLNCEQYTKRCNTINNINKVYKNTSLIRTMQCLCRCIKENIKSKIKNNINNTISLDIFNIMEISKLKMANKFDKEKFIQSFKDFRMKLSFQINIFKGEEDISPKLIFSELFKIVKEEFKNNKINWESNVFDKEIEAEYLPKKIFPHIYEKYERLKNELINPFTEKFYYISLELIKCPKCLIYFQGYAHIPYFISLPASNKDKISNLVKNFFETSKKMEMKCKKCSNHGIKSNKIFTTPKFLMFNIDGEPKEEKILDEIIDITPYKLSNIGPSKYYLYAFISKYKNEYIAVIKNEHDTSWFLLSHIEGINIYKINYTNYYTPIIVIYKGKE